MIARRGHAAAAGVALLLVAEVMPSAASPTAGPRLIGDRGGRSAEEGCRGGFEGEAAAFFTDTSAVDAVTDDWLALCSDACQVALQEPLFTDDPAPNHGFAARACSSRLLQTSLYLCLHVYCQGYHEAARLQKLNGSCERLLPSQPSLPPYYVIVDGLSDEDVAAVRRLQRTEATPATTLGEAVVPSRQLYQNAYDTLCDLRYVRRYHGFYGGLMILFWFAVLGCGMLANLLSVLHRRAYRHGTGPLSLHQYQPLQRSAVALDQDCGGQDDQVATAEAAEAEADAEAVGMFKNGDALQNQRGATTRWPRIWLKRYLTVPATFGWRCSQDFWGWATVPSRMQSVVIGAFAVLNLVSCVHGYRVFAGNLYWPDISKQLYRYVSDRTGTVSYANLPLIWIFGMRNNLLMALTGWQFGTFSNFHRWIARMATVHAIVHSIGYSVLVWAKGGRKDFVIFSAMFFWWTGVVATVAMSLVLGFSFFWFRRHMYELFLVLHILLSVIVLAGMLGHLSIFHGRLDGLIWTCCLVWVLDRILRALRILAFNPAFWRPTRAQASYDALTNMVRLTVPCCSSWYQPQPGTFYYLHLLGEKRFWESHPFTVASVTAQPPPSQLPTERPPNHADEGSPLLDGDASPVFPRGCGLPGQSGFSSSSSQSSGGGKHASTMTFLIRPHDSFTARLRDRAAAPASPTLADGPTPARPLHVLVDGPHGHALSFNGFDSVLFVVGGSGIVVPMSHVTGMGRLRPPSGPRPGDACRRSVRIVWVVREAAFAADVLRSDLDEAVRCTAADGSPAIHLDIYITCLQASRNGGRCLEESESTASSLCGSHEDGDSSSESRHAHPPSDPLKDPALFADPLPQGVHIHHGRADVRAQVRCAMQDNPGYCRLAVVACGPARMADEARRAVVDSLGSKGTGDVEYFEEKFQW